MKQSRPIPQAKRRWLSKNFHVGIRYSVVETNPLPAAKQLSVRSRTLAGRRSP